MKSHYREIKTPFPGRPLRMLEQPCNGFWNPIWSGSRSKGSLGPSINDFPAAPLKCLVRTVHITIVPVFVVRPVGLSEYHHGPVTARTHEKKMSAIGAP